MINHFSPYSYLLSDKEINESIDTKKVEVKPVEAPSLNEGTGTDELASLLAQPKENTYDYLNKRLDEEVDPKFVETFKKLEKTPFSAE